MMRMQLTEEEAKTILRMRELEDAHRAGWNKAIEQIEIWMNTDPRNQVELAEKLGEMKK